MPYASEKQLKQLAGEINGRFAKKNGTYPDMTAGNLIDKNATPVEREFTFDTACGAASIQDDGTAVINTIYGNTHVFNQLVTDSKAVTADGNGTVSIINAVGGSPNGVVFEGRCEQQTLTGKNLIPSDTITYIEGERYYIETPYNFVLTAGTTYTLSFEADISVSGWMTAIGCRNDQSTYSLDIVAATTPSVVGNRYSVTFTPTEEQLTGHDMLAVRFARFGTLTTYSGMVSDIMLEVGSSATTYEQYCGGIPAPNPQYPQAVNINDSEWSIGEGNSDAIDLSEIGLAGLGDAKDTFNSETGECIRKVGVVDIGTLSWTKSPVNPGIFVCSSLDGIADLVTTDMFCTMYPCVNNGQSVATFAANYDKAFKGSTAAQEAKNLYIVDKSISDIETFMTMISGAELYYKLLTPTVETISSQPITLQTGSSILNQISGSIANTHAAVTYDATTYTIPLVAGHKYLYRHDNTDNIITAVADQTQTVDNTDKLIDLTRWFGSGDEPDAAESLYKLYPKLVGDIDASDGQIVSFNGASINTVGFNAYNNGIAELLGGNEYQITGAYTALAYDTGETITPDSDGKFTPSVNGILTVTGGDDTTCVHLVWSGYRDGDYEPYESHSLSLKITELQKHCTNAYIVGNVDMASDWLSLTEDGDPITPASGVLYKIKTAGTFYDNIYIWNTNAYILSEQNYTLIFPHGMLSIGGVKDEVTKDRAVNKIGLRVYSSGDEEDGSVVTDGINTCYVLDTPIITTFDDNNVTGSGNQTSPLDLSYRVNDFGTEKLLPENDDVIPVTTPLKADIAYSSDVTRSIATLLNGLDDVANGNLIKADSSAAGKVSDSGISASALAAVASSLTGLSHETWTFTKLDGTSVNKEVVLWQS